MGGYGPSFWEWAMDYSPETFRPYGSCGNGSAMRVSPVGWFCNSMQEIFEKAKESAECTHNHPEGIKGAQAIATCVFLARTSKDVFSEDTKSSIKEYVEKTFGYNLDFTLNEIRPSYTFDVSCQGSCPHAIRAYLEGKDFEDAVRLAVSIGGDSDTIACMTGAIAGAKGNIPEAYAKTAYQILKPSLRAVLDEFEKTLSERSLC